MQNIVVSYDDDQQQWFWDYFAAKTQKMQCHVANGVLLHRGRPLPVLGAEHRESPESRPSPNQSPIHADTAMSEARKRRHNNNRIRKRSSLSVPLFASDLSRLYRSRIPKFSSFTSTNSLNSNHSRSGCICTHQFQKRAVA